MEPTPRLRAHPGLHLCACAHARSRPHLRRCDRLRAHTCARLANGDVRCFGVNSNGQLGQTNDAGVIVDNDPHPTPAAPSFTGAATSTTSNNFNSCAVTAAGMICWGNNNEGVLTRGAAANANFGPAPIVTDAGTIVSGSMGAEFALGLLGDGTLLSWGRNSSGALGRTARSAAADA